MGHQENVGKTGYFTIFNFFGSGIDVDYPSMISFYPALQTGARHLRATGGSLLQ
jgi:hypothetical protein